MLVIISRLSLFLSFILSRTRARSEVNPATSRGGTSYFRFQIQSLHFVSKGDKQSTLIDQASRFLTIIEPVASRLSPLRLHLGGPLMILCLNLLLGSNPLSLFSLRFAANVRELGWLVCISNYICSTFPASILIFHIVSYSIVENWQESIFARKDVTLPSIRCRCRFESELSDHSARE